MLKDYDNLIFSPSDIPDIPIENIVEDLAEGLSERDSAFMLEAAKELKNRLSERRFAHSVSVAQTSKRLAKLYKVDVSICTRAGLIHDWDKRFRGEDMFERAHELGVELPDGFENMEPLIHSLTGAAAIKKRFPDIEPEILQAVARHTSGAIDMQDADMVVYISDMIEPTRGFERLEPLREMVGKCTLKELFSVCFKSTIQHLVEHERFLHPESANIWNAYVGHRPK